MKKVWRSGTAAGFSAARWLVPSFGSLLVLFALCNAFFLSAGSLFTVDSDGPRHMRVGRLMLEQGGLPSIDVFSHTRPGAAYVPYEWLSQVIMALFDSTWGLAGAAVFAGILHAAAVIGAYRVALELRGPRLLSLTVAVLALILQSIHLLPRPHLFTTVLTAVYMIVLLRFARSGRAWDLAPLPLLMLFWVNAHPGFPIGFVLLGAFAAAAVLRSAEFVAPRRALLPLLAISAISFAATLLNPATIGIWSHMADLLGSDLIQTITSEFQSVDFHTGYGRLFFAALVAGPVCWMTGRVRVSWLGLGLYLLFSAAALLSARNVTLFTVVALPWLATWLAQALRCGSTLERRLLNRVETWDIYDSQRRPLVWAIIAVIPIAIALGPARQLYRFGAEVYPVLALQDLEASRPPGPVLNEMHWGGYLVYSRPDIPVFIDGMTNIYGEELIREYLVAIAGKPGWEDVLERYDVAWTLIAPERPLAQLLDAHPDWVLVYADQVTHIHRRAARTAAPISADSLAESVPDRGASVEGP